MTNRVPTIDFDAVNEVFEKRRRAQDEVFQASPCIHESILRLQCGWSMLLEDIKHMRYHNLGQEGASQQRFPNDAPTTKGHLLGDYLEKLAAEWSIQSWAAEADEWFRATSLEVGQLRNKFAHMLFIEDIEGEWPNRTVTLHAVPRIEGLEFRDGTWSAQKVEVHTVAENDIHKALELCGELISVVRKLDRHISIAREVEEQGRSDEQPGM